MLADLQRTANHAALQAAENGISMKVEVGIYDDEGFGAWASHVDGTDLIGISGGAFPILLGAFWGTIDRIHQGSADNISPPRISTIGHIDDVRNDLRILTNTNRPPSPESEALPIKLAVGSIHYIIYHELAHLINGHVDLLNEEGINHIHETDGPSTDYSIFRQTLEYDADMTAATVLLMDVLRPKVDSSKLPSQWHLPKETMFGSIEDAVRDSAYMLTIPHLFFASLPDLELAEHGGGHHPPPGFRQVANVATIAHNLSRRCGYDHAAWSKIAFDASAEAAQAFYGMFEGARFATETDQVEELVQRYFDRYHEAWADIRPRLERYKRAGRLAPIQPVTRSIY